MHFDQFLLFYLLPHLQNDKILEDAFGIVAMVAMIPLISIQILGFRAVVSNKVTEKRRLKEINESDDEQIINFM